MSEDGGGLGGGEGARGGWFLMVEGGWVGWRRGGAPAGWTGRGTAEGATTGGGSLLDIDLAALSRVV